MTALAGGLSEMLMDLVLHRIDTIIRRIKANSSEFILARKMLY